MKERNSKTVVLTGAGGFLGRNLLPALLDAGFQVVAVSSRGMVELSRLCGCDFNIAGVQVLDPSEREMISCAMRDSIVLGCGFPRGGDGFAMGRGLEFVAWTFRAAAENGAMVAVNVSSQSVYDQYRDRPAIESDLVCPVGDYAVAKYATELMLEASCANMPHTNVRLASLIGPGFDQRVVNKMVNAYYDTERKGTFFESGNRFGFMDVQDATQGLVALCLGCTQCELAPVYNLAAEGSYTISEMAQAVRASMSALGWDQEAGPLIEYREQLDVLQDTSVTASLFGESFGWRARYTLQDTVEAIVHERILRDSSNDEASTQSGIVEAHNRDECDGMVYL